MTREYYEINEDAARQAKAMWSHSDYVMKNSVVVSPEDPENPGRLCDGQQNRRIQKGC